MYPSDTAKSIVDFSNFFDHQLYLFFDKNSAFYSIKNGTIKQIKFPPHLSKLLDDKSIFSKTISNGGEKSILHIFRLGDGHTLFLSDPGTGNVLNGFVLSLITLSSNVCDYSTPTTSHSDKNSMLMDQLVADFDKERKKFAVTDKRQKEEIIILEEQAKEAYSQYDQLQAELNRKISELESSKKTLAALAEQYKELEKRLTGATSTADFNIGAELKKKNDILRDNNQKLVAMLKKSSLSISELQSEVEMCVKDALENSECPENKKTELLNSLNELFTSEKATIS